MVEGCVIGVDLGGTNVRAQALGLDGSPAGQRFEHSSRAQEGTEAIIDSLATTIRQAIAGASKKVLGVGIAVPGHVDDEQGMILWAPNFGTFDNGIFHSWRDVPLKRPLIERLNIPITLGNDANLAALGEYRYGTGENSASCLVMLTLGTGVGGGVVMSPKAVQGDARSPLVLVGGNSGGAELGHIVLNHGGIEANSGAYGTLEGYCQRDSIIRRAQSRILRGRKSLISDLTEGFIENITPRIITEAAEKGDEVAIEVFQEVGEWLGVGIGSIINVFAPDVFAIGGQISKAGKFILEPAIKTAQNVAVPSLWSYCKVVPAKCLDDAGILGGAALAAQHFS